MNNKLFLKKGDLVYIPSNTPVYIWRVNDVHLTAVITHKPQHGVIFNVEKEIKSLYQIEVHIPEYGSVYIEKCNIYEPLKGVKNVDFSQSH